MIAIPQLRMAKLLSFMDDAAKPGGFDGNFRYAVDTESYGALNFSTKKNWFFI
jgi:hypothetical protein